MKKIVFNIILIMLIGTIEAKSQTAPVIQHSQLYGGSQDDHPGQIIQTQDKGYLIGGWTQSNDGQVAGFKGYYDGWAVKIDSLGNFVWGKTIGGTNADNITTVAITSSYYIVGGNTNSIDGDFDTVAHLAVSGFNMGYLAWLDPANGNIKRIKTYSGNEFGEIYNVQALPNGNLIIIGRHVTTGQVKNMWIAMLDSVGTILWGKYYGTGSDTSNEIPASILAKKDGGYIATAQTNSNTGDVHGLHGAQDIWLLSIDDTGKILWAKCYGGSFGQSPVGAYETSDGGFICAGVTQSNDGEVTGMHGGEDYWVFKTDDTGKILWNIAIGGSNNEFMFGMQGTCDDGVVVGGYTNSIDGDVTGLKGPFDLFMVRLDSAGHIVWERTYGSSGVDYEGRIITTADNGYAMVGLTGTSDDDVSGTLHGYGDIWFAKLAPDSLFNYCPPLTTAVPNIDFKKRLMVYPNPATNELFIENASAGSSIKIFNVLGQQVYNSIVIEDKQQIRLNNFIPGTYLLQIVELNGNRTNKTINVRSN